MENFGWEKCFFPLKKLFFKWGWLHPITISPASKDSFTKLYGVDSQLIYNGIPHVEVTNQNLTEKYQITPKTKIFIHAGRISKEKNQLILCKVFKSLIDQNEDVVLLIAGCKQNQDIFESLEPFLCDRIIYLGERNDIPQLMAHCDAMCLPSIWEGLPVTLLESLSVGCIPICSPVGGIPDVILNGQNGFLSESCDENDYKKALSFFLALPKDKIDLLKRRCILSFSKYDIKYTSNSYLEHYKTSLK
jgi:glycosyltransferase involved in cell wall biosynthesis